MWIDRLTAHFRRSLWINPLKPDYWGYTQSVGMIRQLMGNRMYPLTLGGLEEAARELAR